MPASQEAREYPPLPRPTGWITNWKDFLARRDGVIYSYMWRPDGKPHPLDVQMFTAEQVYACIDADRKARQQEALDARRYRWLRDGAMTSHHSQATRIATRMYGFEWDAAIDAAIAKGESRE